ncbi:LysR substrate-binding domain-containing protein [Roseateles sp. DXS20W]|uniref:LysR substrate-binding domain-containing protein n=1 Tax=Pelomonas lactea TaxID=3299030 RepID=A0ABW7GGW6_9BURK
MAAVAAHGREGRLQHLAVAGLVTLRSNNRQVQAALCAAGRGWTVLPCPLGDAHPGLVKATPPEAPPGRQVYLGYHRDPRRLGRLQRLVEHVVGRLAPVTMPADPQP